MFDGHAFDHLTYEELMSRVFGPELLVENMIMQFEIDDLDRFYIPTKARNTDIAWVSENYNLVYNPFIDFAIQERLGDLLGASIYWEQHMRHDVDPYVLQLPNKYDDKIFEKAYGCRLGLSPVELESMVADWVNDDSVTEGLALLGSYGTGKSSFAKRLAHVWAQRYKHGETKRIPFLIELREFGSHQDIRGLITHELINKHGVKNGSFELFQLLNRQGRFLLILDGFDEMKQGITRDALIFNFNELNKLHTDNSKVLLCGRPTIFESEKEQTQILSALEEANFTDSARYIQIAISAFTLDESLKFIKDYTAVKNPLNLLKVIEKANELERELPYDNELASLLTRPVHLPMLVSILPEWSASVRELSRKVLYHKFIDKIITRELLRQRKEFQHLYNVELRHRFASELAVAMFGIGDVRSIRYSEIPEEIVRGFQRRGQTFESVKRDLVAACFLERKPPDILTFGHKSFTEYLGCVDILPKPYKSTNETQKAEIAGGQFVKAREDVTVML